MEKSGLSWYSKFVKNQSTKESGWLENNPENYPIAVDFLIKQSRSIKPKPLGLFFEAGIQSFFGTTSVRPKTKEDKKMMALGSEWAREQWEKNLVIRRSGDTMEESETEEDAQL